MRRTTSFGMLMLALLVARGSLGADESMEQRRAAVPFKEGLSLAAAGKNEEARVAFAQAYAAYASPNILFNLAKAEALTGRTTTALRHFKQVTRDSRATPDAVRMSNEQIGSLNKLTGHAKVTAPAGANITLDADAYPERPPFADVVDVMPGDHRIKADMDGKHAEATFSAPAGATVEVILAWPAPPVATATSVVLPPTASSASPTSERPRVDIGTPPPREPETSNTKWIVGGTLAGVGVAGVVTGIVLGSASQSAKDDVTKLEAAHACAPGGDVNACSQLHSKSDEQSSKSTGAIVAYAVGGGAIVAGGVVMYLAWRDGPTTKSVSLRPMNGATGAILSGSF